MRSRQNHEHPEKILLAMLELSNGATCFLKYEDIVVKAFRMYPEEFALRGHPEFPDSSDIHKPLYTVLKRKGMVRAANKHFALTGLGVEAAQQLMASAGSALHQGRSGDRLTRAVQAEVGQMMKCDAYRLIAGDQPDRVLDTDLYAFLGCTVRTRPNDFVGRIAATENAIDVAVKLSKPEHDSAMHMRRTWVFLSQQFYDLIERKSGVHGRRAKGRIAGKGAHRARAAQQ